VVTDVFPRHEVRSGVHVCFHGLEDYRKVLAAEGCTIIGIRPLCGLMNGVVFDWLGGARRRWRKMLRGFENMAAPVLHALDGLWIPMSLPNAKLLIAQRSESSQ